MIVAPIQAVIAGFMLGRELIKYLNDRNKCKLDRQKQAKMLIKASKDMRKARKAKDVKGIEDIFRGLNLDAPSELSDGGSKDGYVDS